MPAGGRHIYPQASDEGPFAELTGSVGNEGIVVTESTFIAFWLYHRISALVRSYRVLNGRAVNLRSNNTNKLDTRKLLELLSTFAVTHTMHPSHADGLHVGMGSTLLPVKWDDA